LSWRETHFFQIFTFSLATPKLFSPATSQNFPWRHSSIFTDDTPKISKFSVGDIPKFHWQLPKISLATSKIFTGDRPGHPHHNIFFIRHVSPTKKGLFLPWDGFCWDSFFRPARVWVNARLSPTQKKCFGDSGACDAMFWMTPAVDDNHYSTISRPGCFGDSTRHKRCVCKVYSKKRVHFLESNPQPPLTEAFLVFHFPLLPIHTHKTLARGDYGTFVLDTHPLSRTGFVVIKLALKADRLERI
jgi:hypothetical protein